MRLVCAVALAGGVLAPGTAIEAGEGTATRLVVDPPGFDFGRVRPAQRVMKEFRLRNAGTVAVKIQSVSSTCACTVAPLADEARQLAPGASVALRVTLTTTNELGPMSQTVDVKLSDDKAPVTEIRLKATVVGRRK